MSKHVLSTAGAGFIGSHLCERFLDEGHEVVCVDNFITGSLGNLDSFRDRPKFSFIGHDISNVLKIRGPIDRNAAGTSTVRTSSVSSSTPSATAIPTSATGAFGSRARSANVPARTIPAAVMTPPVTASPRSVPCWMPPVRDSSRMRALRKML